MNTITYAHHYADGGIPVGPVRGKIPLTPNGFKNFTTDHKQIDLWWSDYPDANIGGCVDLVVDIDAHHGGHLALAELVRDGYRLPKTLTAQSGNFSPNKPHIRGMHAYFTAPAGLKWKQQLCAGVDLKVGSRGFIVMPPSIHPNGNAYVWMNDLPMAPVPSWIVHRGTHKPKPVVKAQRRGDGSALVRTVAEATEGNRHGVLLWASKTAFDEGVLDEKMIAEMTDAARDAGLPDSEIEGVFRWAVSE